MGAPERTGKHTGAKRDVSGTERNLMATSSLVKRDYEIAVLRIVPLAETLQLSNKMGKFLYFPFIY